jgi:YggT family protein
MFVISNFLIALAHVLNIVLNILWMLILVRALVSWVNPDPFNPIIQFLNKTTEPILSRIRKILPSSLKFGIDISPLIAIIVIVFVQMFLVNSLKDLAINLKYGG